MIVNDCRKSIISILNEIYLISIAYVKSRKIEIVMARPFKYNYNAALPN